MLKCSGAVVNRRAAAAMRRSIEAARHIPAASVTVLRAQRGPCKVVSYAQAPLEHMIEDALGDDPHCSCAAGSQGGICKHLVRCMVLLGISENKIYLMHGSLKGTQLPDGTPAPLRCSFSSRVAEAAPPGAIPAPAVAATQSAAQTERQPLDRTPKILAGLQKLQGIAERKELPSAEMLAAVNTALATVNASIIDKEALPGVLQFAVSGTARGSNSKNRDLTLSERVTKRRGAGSGVRVVADATDAAAAGLPAAFPRRRGAHTRRGRAGLISTARRSRLGLLWLRHSWCVQLVSCRAPWRLPGRLQMPWRLTWPR